MHTRKVLSIIFGFIFAFSLMLVPAARADEWDQASKLTFSQPIEIPGHKILAAGTYWFVTMADLANPNLVQVFNADRTRLDATIPSVSTERTNPSPRTEINFAEPQGNEPKALVSWFYPGSKTGHEFVYSHQEEKVVAAEPIVKVIAGD
jgi:hypothetical protein